MEVLGCRLLEVETQVIAWHFEEVGQGLCIRGGITLSPLVIGSEMGRMLWWRLVAWKGIGVLNGR